MAPATEESALLPKEEGHHRHLLHHQNSHIRSLGEDVPLYARPRQRQRWDDHQILPHVNWGDLFFDLFYVAAAYNLAVILKDSTTAEGLLYFVCCYLSIVIIWYEKLGYDARYAPDDNLFHRSMEVVHLVLLGTAIQHVRPVEFMADTCHHSTTFFFLLPLSIIYLMHLSGYIDLIHHVDGGPEAVEAARSDVKRKLAGGLPVWIGTCLAARDYFSDTCVHGSRLPVILSGNSLFIEQAVALFELLHWIPTQGKSHKEVRVPMNLEFTTHRLGEWVMLMLGESVLSLIIVEDSPGRRYFVTFAAGIVAVTMMQYLYFRSTPMDADDHAMRRSIQGGYQFFYSLLAYSACLIIIGCSFKLILHVYLDEYEKEEEGVETDEEEQEEMVTRISNMFSWSLASSFLLLDLMVISHRGWILFFKRLAPGGQIAWKPCICCIADMCMIIMTAYFPRYISDLEVLSVAGCGVVLAQVLLRTLGMKFFPVSKAAMDFACRWPNVTEPRIADHDST